jgi:hypothetical protein
MTRQPDISESRTSGGMTTLPEIETGVYRIAPETKAE